MVRGKNVLSSVRWAAVDAMEGKFEVMKTSKVKLNHGQ